VANKPLAYRRRTEQSMLCVYSYTGHLPTMKLDYAETYGKHGVKYFQDFRSRALETSKNNISRGGYFPSIHTFGPDPAVASRTRLWDRWLQMPHYRLHNEDHDRREELIDFCKVSLLCGYSLYTLLSYLHCSEPLRFAMFCSFESRPIVL